MLCLIDFVCLSPIILYLCISCCLGLVVNICMCGFICVLFFVLRVKTDDLSLSLYFNANENRVDERKRGERRRGAVGERLGRHRRNGRFQDAFERGIEEERPQEINTNNERYYDDFFREEKLDLRRRKGILRFKKRRRVRSGGVVRQECIV